VVVGGGEVALDLGRVGIAPNAQGAVPVGEQMQTTARFAPQPRQVDLSRVVSAVFTLAPLAT
jgi:hypothetical protein